MCIRDRAELGCQTVTLSGGEPLLRSDWPELAAAITGQGMVLEMVTNGFLVAAQADRIAAAGFNTVTFSVDGTSEPHDRLRGVAGALERLEAFASFNGPDFYRLPRNTPRITLRRDSWIVPQSLPFGPERIVPLAGGETLAWRLTR